MNGCAAREAARESGGEGVQSIEKIVRDVSTSLDMTSSGCRPLHHPRCSFVRVLNGQKLGLDWAVSKQCAGDPHFEQNAACETEWKRNCGESDSLPARQSQKENKWQPTDCHDCHQTNFCAAILEFPSSSRD